MTSPTYSKRISEPPGSLELVLAPTTAILLRLSSGVHRGEASGRDRALVPKGAKNGFAGGVDFNNDCAIWDALDRAVAKHADMVLMDGDSSKGAEFVASRWAGARNVT